MAESRPGTTKGQIMDNTFPIKMGIEIGGTFTDLILLDQHGIARIEKVLSTPGDLTDGAIHGFQKLLQTSDCPASAVTELLHGSTIATNALIERKGAGVGVLMTAGFEDVLIIGRQERDDVNDMFYQRSAPLIQRRDIRGITERVSVDGEVLIPVCEDQALASVRYLVDELGHDSIAICLLHAYRNPSHEELVAMLIKQHYPDVKVSCSSEVCPEHREYERASTTVLSAYVRPVVGEYLKRLRERVAAEGFRGTPLIMQSNGGVLPVEAAVERPAHMYLSGPAAGVTGAVHFARTGDFPNLITMDVGGTSCDVSLISLGSPQLTSRGTTGFRVHGQPLNLVMMDIFALGAGGGSIAHEDVGGMLQVGPHSAGAQPGPACYGQGGTAFTLTDALLLLGLVDRSRFASGSVNLDEAAALRACETLCTRYEMDALELANSVLEIAVANVAQGLRLSTVQRGHDPRDYALCAYGGGGPLLAAFVAQALGIRQIVVPPVPGVFSAFGLCVADMRMDFVRALPGLPISKTTLPTITEAMGSLSDEADAAFLSIGMHANKLVKSYTVDARYAGQGYELRISIESDSIATAGHGHIEEVFHERHRRHYGHHFPERSVEIVNVRITCEQQRSSAFSRTAETVTGGEGQTRSVKISRLQGDWPVKERSQLTTNWGEDGPLLIVENTSTTVVPMGWKVRKGDSDCLIVEQVEVDET